MRAVSTLVLILSSAACASRAPETVASQPATPSARQSQNPAAAPAKPPNAATRLSKREPVERPELNQEFQAERVSGTIALYDTADETLVCSDVKRCKQPHLPASTFKIPNSIVALETGVTSDPEAVLKWDGTTRPVQAWNQDMTLRRAMQVSCLPCFQEIARKIGEEQMATWVKRLEYGNQNLAGGVDRFWIWGALRISPLDQLDFLRRLELGQLPIQASTRETVIDLITLDLADDYLLRGKTGSSSTPAEPETIGWFVGWVERGPRRIFFATALDSFQPGVDVMKVRRQLTERVLRRMGAL